MDPSVCPFVEKIVLGQRIGVAIFISVLNYEVDSFSKSKQQH
jgi:hypothetical protein